MSGSKKPDSGVLPIEHPSIFWLADKGHHIQQLISKLFILVAKKKAECEGTKFDVKRIN
jgi:hypothetical protein